MPRCVAPIGDAAGPHTYTTDGEVHTVWPPALLDWMKWALCSGNHCMGEEHN